MSHFAFAAGMSLNLAKYQVAPFLSRSPSILSMGWSWDCTGRRDGGWLRGGVGIRLWPLRC